MSRPNATAVVYQFLKERPFFYVVHSTVCDLPLAALSTGQGTSNCEGLCTYVPTFAGCVCYASLWHRNDDAKMQFPRGDSFLGPRGRGSRFTMCNPRDLTLLSLCIEQGWRHLQLLESQEEEEEPFHGQGLFCPAFLDFSEKENCCSSDVACLLFSGVFSPGLLHPSPAPLSPSSFFEVSPFPRDAS